MATELSSKPLQNCEDMALLFTPPHYLQRSWPHTSFQFVTCNFLSGNVWKLSPAFDIDFSGLRLLCGFIFAAALLGHACWILIINLCLCRTISYHRSLIFLSFGLLWTTFPLGSWAWACSYTWPGYLPSICLYSNYLVIFCIHFPALLYLLTLLSHHHFRRIIKYHFSNIL